MKPSPVLSIAVRRMRLTTKQGPKGYYKGTRTGSMGTHTKFGKYLIDYNKVRTYVMPDLTGFELTPFVSKRLAMTRDRSPYLTGSGPTNGKDLIQQWKDAGGVD